NGLPISFAAHRKVPASLFGQVTRLRHIDTWNAFSFNKLVLPFHSIALHSHQFVIITRCKETSAWRRRDVCNFQPPAFVYVGILRNWNESRFCLWAVLWLRKCLFRFSRVDVRSDLFGARINNSSRNETRNRSH